MRQLITDVPFGFWLELIPSIDNKTPEWNVLSAPLAWYRQTSTRWLQMYPCKKVAIHKPRRHLVIQGNAWWRHQMDTFSALLAICAGNSPVTGEFPAQRPATRSFDVFFDLRLNKQFSKQSWGWWFEPPSRSLWVLVMAFRLLGLMWIEANVRTSDVSFDVSLKNTLNKQSNSQWF